MIGDQKSGRSSRRYRIRIGGEIDPSWSDRLGGLSIRRDEEKETDGQATSTLEGVLRDRAALLGVLSTLHDLNVSLISVQSVNLEEEEGPQ